MIDLDFVYLFRELAAATFSRVALVKESFFLFDLYRFPKGYFSNFTRSRVFAPKSEVPNIFERTLVGAKRATVTLSIISFSQTPCLTDMYRLFIGLKDLNFIAQRKEQKTEKFA
ncbi:uncharacterized protein LOC111396980 [Olea europaea var. sylvestris]|uniref:uncharacterized protein LOC111396980 n=1 Tax=Olea europaea var. sylvestris TaxID=158386 RepID=UPI000C1D3EC5|nr:uncharacterized protein LOC111396980 [Olea europaea var. sylvestris]